MGYEEVLKLIHVGINFRRAGRFDEAIASLAQVLEIEPWNQWARIETAESLYGLGRRAEAISFLEAGLKFERQVGHLYVALSEFAVRASDFDGAVILARKAVDAAPTNGSCAANLVARLAQAGRHDESTAYCSEFTSQEISDKDRASVLHAWSVRQTVAAAENVRLTAERQSDGRPLSNAVLVMMVKDERDFVGVNLAYHYNLGFRYYAINDNLSRDGTSDVIRKFRDTHKDVVLLHIEDPVTAYMQDVKTTAIAKYAIEFMQAADAKLEWVFPIDADELIAIPAGADLQQVLLDMDAAKQVLGVYGFTEYGPDEIIFADEELRPGASQFPLHFPFMHQPVVKSFYRTNPAAHIQNGNHFIDRVAGGPRDIAILAERGAWLCHFPNRGVVQLRKKILNGGRALDAAGAKFPGGDHWRRHGQQYAVGGDDYIVSFLKGRETLMRLSGDSNLRGGAK